MKPLTVIGLGSAHGEDQVGLQVANRLANSDELAAYIPDQLRIELMSSPQLALVSLLDESDDVIIIDAVKSGAPAGILHCLVGDQIGRLQSDTMSSHGFGLAQSMALAQSLDCLPDRMHFYGIEINRDAPEDELSEAVLAARDQLVEVLKIFLLKQLKKKVPEESPRAPLLS